LIWPNREAEYFCKRGWTEKYLICPSGRSFEIRTAFAANATRKGAEAPLCVAVQRRQPRCQTGHESTREVSAFQLLGFGGRGAWTTHSTRACSGCLAWRITRSSGTLPRALRLHLMSRRVAGSTMGTLLGTLLLHLVAGCLARYAFCEDGRCGSNQCHGGKRDYCLFHLLLLD